MKVDFAREELAAELRGSLQKFTEYFTKYLTGRDYIHTYPASQESHQVTICRTLTQITRMELEGNVLFNVAPGTGKTWHLCMWVAWCFTHYADCNFIYISYAKTMAATQTSFIKTIMTSAPYSYLFGVEISRDSRAKDHFSTTARGQVAAFGSAGAVTGRNAGLPGLDRFSGAVIIDDPVKPDEVASPVIRAALKNNYNDTISQRPRGINVPIVFIGQRLHEDDLAAYLLEGHDIRPWTSVILASEDVHGNALHPERYPKELLAKMREQQPYMYAAQHLQNPLPAGGALFKPEWIIKTDEYPKIIKTFLTCDTAETSKSYNDASVFSFWGIYEIENFGRKTGQLGLHSIDMIEIRIEPKDLKEAFMDFWAECCRFDVAPNVAAIEKKSTGVTLISVLSEIRGITIKDIPRTVKSGSKSDRFIAIQDFLAAKRLSVNENARHKEMFLTHLSKITANNSHRFDDIADTLADAVQLVLTDPQFSIKNEEIVSTNKRKMKAMRESMLTQINIGR